MYLKALQHPTTRASCPKKLRRTALSRASAQRETTTRAIRGTLARKSRGHHALRPATTIRGAPSVMLRQPWRSFREHRGLLSAALLLTTSSCMCGIMSVVISCVEMSAAPAAPSCPGPGASAASARVAGVEGTPPRGAAAAPQLLQGHRCSRAAVQPPLMRLGQLRGVGARVRDGHEQPAQRHTEASTVRGLRDRRTQSGERCLSCRGQASPKLAES